MANSKMRGKICQRLHRSFFWHWTNTHERRGKSTEHIQVHISRFTACERSSERTAAVHTTPAHWPTSPAASVRTFCTLHAGAHQKAQAGQQRTQEMNHARPLPACRSRRLLNAAQAGSEITCAHRGTPAHHMRMRGLCWCAHSAKACAGTLHRNCLF